MKACKHYIDFEAFDSIDTTIEISKVEFESQMERMIEQSKQSVNYETPIDVLEAKTFEHSYAWETVYRFNCGCSSIVLRKVQCKEGYRFANKRGI